MIRTFIAELLVRMALLLAAYGRGHSDAEKKHLKQEAEDAKEEAQAWADIPHIDADFHNLMRDRIEKKRKARD